MDFGSPELGVGRRLNILPVWFKLIDNLLNVEARPRRKVPTWESTRPTPPGCGGRKSFPKAPRGQNIPKSGGGGQKCYPIAGTNLNHLLHIWRACGQIT